MKKIITTALLALSIMAIAQTKNLHSFSAKTIDGKDFNFSSLKGKKILVVNTASECGLTPQYKELEALYKEYKDKGFVIVGFPANNFGSQEPGTNTEIKSFCTKNYGVTFQMMEKISVKGDDKHPIYKYLTEKKENGKMDAEVSWNFQKFLIDEKGDLVGVVNPQGSPKDEKIIQFITKK
jgi:glutathione peroxidase